MNIASNLKPLLIHYKEFHNYKKSLHKESRDEHE